MPTLDRSFAIIELLARERDPVPLSVLSERLGLPKSSLHLVLGLLIEQGYVRQDKSTERYGLTMRLPALGFRYLAATGLVDACQPILDHVAGTTQTLVQLRIVDGDELIRVGWSQGSQSPLRYVPTWGAREALHATAAGTIWLAALSETEAARLVLAQGFGAAADRSGIATLPQLFARLGEVRAQGYGLNIEATMPGISAVAVAIRIDGAAIVGTIAIAGPAVDLPETRLRGLAPSLRAAADELALVWPMRDFLTKRGDSAQAGLTARPGA